MKALRLIGFVLAAVVTGPLWPVGFVLAFTHRWLNALALAVIRWGFWEPCRWAGVGMVQSWRACWAEKPEVHQSEAAERMRLRARRARRGR